MVSKVQCPGTASRRAADSFQLQLQLAADCTAAGRLPTWGLGRPAGDPPQRPQRRRRLPSVSRATSRVGALGRRSLGSFRRSWEQRTLPRTPWRAGGAAASAPRVGRVHLDVAERGDNGGCLDSLCKGCLSACCCCGCCCCCLNLQYVRTRPGMLRLAELVLSWLCNWLLGRYALRVAGMLGSAMPSFFLCTAGAALGCSVLLAVSLLSARSVGLLRASLFEIAFHATSVGLYASQASYVHVATTIYLEPYKNDVESYTYPAVVTSYWLGYALAVLHSLDLVYSLKHYRQYRS